MSQLHPTVSPHPEVTTWPPIPVPEPEVMCHPTALEGDFIVSQRDVISEFAPLPPEFVLRQLMTLDTESPAAIAALLSEHGLLLPVHTAMDASPFVPLSGTTPPPGQDRRSGHIEMHWLDVAWELRLLRAIVRHWKAGERGQSLADAWKAEGFDPWARHEMWPAEIYPVAALPWLLFEHAINAGLGEFTVRANVKFQSADGLVQAGAPERRYVHLYDAACLQLWNLIADGIPIKDCANERCSFSFGRQYDGARRTQHRSKGVLYCSQKCARAQAERERRRRLRTEKKG